MTRVQATVVCDIIMLYALEERNVYKKSIIDDELKSANIAIAKTAFALIDRAVRNSCTYPLLTYLLTYLLPCGDRDTNSNTNTNSDL